MMCGLTPPSRGTVRVLGADARRDRNVRGRIGLAPQQDALFDRLDAVDFVTIAAATQGVADPTGAARHALGLVELDPDDPRPVSGYSKGMRQRTKLAAALVHDPDVLILDEPLNGLDPVQRRRMIELLEHLGAQGRCVLVSSHVLEEVARLGSRILVIAQARLIASGDYRELREMMDDRPHRISIEADRPRPLAAALVESGTVVGVKIDGDVVVADTLEVDRLGREIAPLARRLGARLRAVRPLMRISNRSSATWWNDDERFCDEPGFDDCEPPRRGRAGNSAELPGADPPGRLGGPPRRTRRARKQS